MNPSFVSTVICPHCHVELDAKASRCTACGAELSPAVQTSEEHRVVDRPWFILLILLHLGFLGIPYYWKTRYSASTRLMICLASIAYTIFAVAVIFWGLLQVARLFV